MLINIEKYNVCPIGVVHVGAHYGEEHELYKRIGARKIIYIEPCAEAFEVLQERFASDPTVVLAQTACGAKMEQREINIEKQNKGQSNSFLQMGTHLQLHPGIKFTEKEIVTIVPLDFLNTTDCDMLNIDVQGFELEVLKGAKNMLAAMNYVYVEVNKEQVYKGCPHYTEIVSFLEPYGFALKEIKWFADAWGDAFFMK